MALERAFAGAGSDRSKRSASRGRAQLRADTLGRRRALARRWVDSTKRCNQIAARHAYDNPNRRATLDVNSLDRVGEERLRFSRAELTERQFLGDPSGLERRRSHRVVRRGGVVEFSCVAAAKCQNGFRATDQRSTSLRGIVRRTSGVAKKCRRVAPSSATGDICVSRGRPME